jgi:phosphate butyryltransferase
MKTLTDLIIRAQQKTINKIAVVAAHDEPVLEAVKYAIDERISEPILIGDEEKIRTLCAKINLKIDHRIEIIHEPDPSKAAYIAVALIHEGKADIIMKGMISTAPLLKAILHKEKGIKKAETLSHFALFETPYYKKLLGVTDAAMNIAPNLDEKKAIILNAVDIMHRIGYSKPKVAIVTPLEVVNPKIDSTVHAAQLKELNKSGEIADCIIDGPLALDNAISLEAAKHKGIQSDVAGDADILMVPDLNSGNILYKSLIFLGGASSAAVIAGAKVPIVLTSRSDTHYTKLLSIALAASLK